jgi:hypothetical protein
VFVRPFALLAAIIHGTINTRRVDAMEYRANILPKYMRQLAAARGDRREAHQRIVKLYGNDSYVTRAAVGAVSGSDVELAEATMGRNGREGVTARQRASIAVMPRVLALLLRAAQRQGATVAVRGNQAGARHRRHSAFGPA